MAVVESKIGQFYTGKTVFITGATGFMGKVLVEKLLRSTGVKKIYLLIRPKKGVQTKVRLEELMSTRIFDKLKETSPDVMARVEVISGDITEPNFGISEEDERKLIEEVNVAFHSAATINFNEDLTKAVNLNVVSVFTIMEICKKMKNLEVLVHVSTAYCKTEFKHITEEIYHGDPVGIIDLCKRMDPSLLNSPEMTKQIIGNKPNTYTFTKELGEKALETAGGCLPIAIVRPSIVIGAWKEPLPGWIENLNGPIGALAGAGKGVLRTVRCSQAKVADLVPVDVPINLSIAAAWKTATQPSNAIPVYNCTSGTKNPLKWGQLWTIGLEAMIKYPMECMVWYPGGTMKDSDWVNTICQATQHTVPAYLADSVAYLIGRKPIMRRVVEKMHKAMSAVEYFATNEWKWSNHNVDNLYMELTEVDKKTFNFDLTTLNWSDYIVDLVKGTRQYIFKEDLATMEQSRRHCNNLFWLEKCLQIFLLIGIGMLFSWLFL